MARLFGHNDWFTFPHYSIYNFPLLFSFEERVNAWNEGEITTKQTNTPIYQQTNKQYYVMCPYFLSQIMSTLQILTVAKLVPDFVTLTLKITEKSVIC